LKTTASIRALASIFAIALAVGCATTEPQPGLESSTSPGTQIEKIEYYPFQVKGYQNSYPRRTVTVLMPTLAADVGDVPPAEAAPFEGNPAIGQVIDQHGNVTERLYASPLPVIVQGAIARSAEEAGMTAKASSETTYKTGTMADQDYVFASKITRCWVKKNRAPDGQMGAVWHSVADFQLDVTIYKPPFSEPFWSGSSHETYYDPPVGSFALGPEDEAGVYDYPGQVLSVALTRAVAGIFEKPDLRNLVLEDDIHQH
jgi:hypothetical protein